jgi:hypothetical protein
MSHIRRLPIVAGAFVVVACNGGDAAHDGVTAPALNLAQAGQASEAVAANVQVPVLRGIVESFHFSAVRRNGVVSGEWTVKDPVDPEAPGLASGTVICFSIQPDGRTVFLGGVIERNNFGIPAGSGAAWTVVDNGKPGAGVDLSTDLTFGFPSSNAATNHCATGTTFTNIPPTPLLAGNVQVKR